MISHKRIKSFQKEILSWYAKHKRELPWRRTRNPYRILVSEVMLQQTQVSRVIPKYEEWLRRFPTIEALAKASMRDVLQAWSGLGYNRRALYLKKIAEMVISRHSGERSDSRIKNGSWTSQDDSSRQARTIQFPTDIAELKKLPGIGGYTARAIACFAFDQQVAVVDTNIRKVILIRFFQLSVLGDQLSDDSQSVVSSSVKPRNREQTNQDLKTENRKPITESEIQQIADQLLPKGKAYDWNHALMDYSAMVLSRTRLQTRFVGSKQSKFLGSNRYYRGQVIKLLVEKERTTLHELTKLLDKDESFLKNVVADLNRDGLLQFSKESIVLTSS